MPSLLRGLRMLYEDLMDAMERIESKLDRLIEALAEDEETETSLDGRVESRSRQEGEPL